MNRTELREFGRRIATRTAAVNALKDIDTALLDLCEGLEQQRGDLITLMTAEGAYALEIAQRVEAIDAALASIHKATKETR